jgi:hypothetical protein
MFSFSKEAQVEFEAAEVALNVLNVLKEEEHYLQHTSSDPDSLIDTNRRQNSRHGLTNVTDSMFDFFITLTDVCLAKLINENLIRYGKSMFNNCLDIVQNEKCLYEKFSHMVVTKIQDVTQQMQSGQEQMEITHLLDTMVLTSTQICSIYNEIIHKYFTVLFAQFCKDMKDSFHVEKTMAHRKQIKVSKTKEKSKPKSVVKDKSKRQTEQTVTNVCEAVQTPSPVQQDTEPQPGTSSLNQDLCKQCQKSEGVQWIQCDSCDAWLHRKCAGLQNAKKWKKLSKEGASWFCKECA